MTLRVASTVVGDGRGVELTTGGVPVLVGGATGVSGSVVRLVGGVLEVTGGVGVGVEPVCGGGFSGSSGSRTGAGVVTAIGAGVGVGAGEPVCVGGAEPVGVGVAGGVVLVTVVDPDGFEVVSEVGAAPVPAPMPPPAAASPAS
jgi:hypothetical protein